MNTRNIAFSTANRKCPPQTLARRAVSALSLTIFLAAACQPIQFAVADVPADLRDWTTAQMTSLLDLYHHFHQNPELSLAEKETSARLAKELQDAGAKVTTGVGGYGVVGVLENGPGKTLLIRTDMDALPVAEQTGLPFASTVRTKDEQGGTVGVMHACGHDLHMTNFVGVARYLASHRDQWSGTIVFIGQPAEELGKGAKAMLDDGLFARFPRPISPSRSTTPPTRPPAKSATTPATRKPTSTASTSSSKAAAATARIPKRPSTRSSSPPGWSSICKRSSAARPSRPSRP